MMIYVTELSIVLSIEYISDIHYFWRIGLITLM